MDGIINLNKPAGITSAKAVYRVRKLTGQRKSGHAGTLDPGARGVLLICLGRATKLVESLMDLRKAYRTTARLDVTSESLDADSDLRPVEVVRTPARAAVEAALSQFLGRIEQVPPAISALKVGGRPAYKLTRAGKAPALAPRLVTVYGLKLISYDWPHVELEITGGRGTYIRALVRDLGATLGTGGCLTELSRTAIGPFQQSAASSFEQLATAIDAGNTDWLTPVDRAQTLIDDARAEHGP